MLCVCVCCCLCFDSAGVGSNLPRVTLPTLRMDADSSREPASVGGTVLHERRLPEPVPIATDLESANRWAEHNVAKALEYMKRLPCGSATDDDHDHMSQMAHICDTMTMSTCMSGTGGAEVSSSGNALCLQHFLRRRVRAPKTLWACDYSIECRCELQLLPHPPICLFTDVTSCLNPSVAGHLKKHASTMRYSDMQKILKHPKIAVPDMPVGCCCIHPTKSCTAERADLHAAGTECPAWSSQGARGGCSGDRVIVWASWLGHRRLLREPIIYHENVVGFPLELLQAELGDLYLVLDSMSAVVSPSAFGQAYERQRRLTLLWNKSYIAMHACHDLILGSSFNDFCQLAQRDCAFSWDSYFTLDESSSEELQHEIAWSSRRPSHRTDQTKPACERPDRCSWEQSDFDRALTDWEATHSYSTPVFMPQDCCDLPTFHPDSVPWESDTHFCVIHVVACKALQSPANCSPPYFHHFKNCAWNV